MLKRMVVMAMFIATATGEYNSYFCAKRMMKYTPSTMADGEKPHFYDNFYVFMEMKSIMNSSVYYMDDYYSQQTQKTYFNVANKTFQSQVWVDAITNEFMVGATVNSICQDAKLVGTDFARYIGVTVDPQGDINLNTPEVALDWQEKYHINSTFLGVTKNDRGLAVQRWAVCSYNMETDVTSVTEWDIIDTSNALPGTKKMNPKPVLPVRARGESVIQYNPPTSYGQPALFSVDFTMYDTIDPNGTVFKVPPEMICAAKPSEKISLPNNTYSFQFRGEQIQVNNPTSSPPDPASVMYTVEKYMYGEKIFIQDYFSAPNLGSTNGESYQRYIHDYNINVTFTLYLLAGTCSGNYLISGGDDTITLPGGLQTMKTFKQFFDLDSSQFQYMGINTKRGIDCDTWSVHFNDSISYHQQNAITTLYLANPNWMKTYRYMDLIDPLPVAMEELSDKSFIQFNFFDFDARDVVDIPDVSLCMDIDFTLNVELYLSVKYQDIMAYPISEVYRGLYQAVMVNTAINTLLRLSKFDLTPFGTETSVKFKLFDLRYLHLAGIKYGPTNKYIYNQLQSSISSGLFYVSITNPSNYSQTTAFYARENSLGLYEDGKFTGSTQYQNANGYSAGAMAGIGLGMLVLGLLIGVAAIAGFKKVREIRSAGDSDKAKLDNESET